MLLFVLFFILGIVMGLIGIGLLHRWEPGSAEQISNPFRRHHS